MPVWTLGLWIGEAYEDGNLAIFSIPRQMHIEEIVSRDMDMEVFVLLRRPVFVFFSFSGGFLFFVSLGPPYYTSFGFPSYAKLAYVISGLCLFARSRGYKSR